MTGDRTAPPPRRVPVLWSAPDKNGRQTCRVCRGRGFQFGKLRPSEKCYNCDGKARRWAPEASS